MALRFLDAAMKSEYAMDITEQSSLNLLTILATPIVNSEHYHVLAILTKSSKSVEERSGWWTNFRPQVKTRIKTGWQLTAIHQTGQGYQLIFNAEGKKETVEADHIILAIPFTVLRTIETDFKFPERKQRCIETIGFGNAAKAAMGFKNVCGENRVFRDMPSRMSMRRRFGIARWA